MSLPEVAPATAQQLLLTAERLFAAHGLAGVSLRQIAAEGGSANNSAVAYHFGSKERLVEAIFAYRLPQLLQRRALLNARVHPGDLKGRLEAQFLPLFELAESRVGSYLSFVEQLQRQTGFQSLLRTTAESTQSQEDFVADVTALMPDIDQRVRALRIQQVQMLSLHAAAERERAVAAEENVIPFGLFVSTLIDAYVGYLRAPVSTETKRFLARDDAAPSDAYPRLL